MLFTLSWAQEREKVSNRQVKALDHLLSLLVQEETDVSIVHRVAGHHITWLCRASRILVTLGSFFVRQITHPGPLMFNA